MTEVPDWAEFLDPDGLPRKAGCERDDIARLALRELADNALDAGAAVTLSRQRDTWTVADNGPGMHPASVATLFAANRPLLSSKRKRLPTRGMLGNGLRVVVGTVAVLRGTLIVETRGRRLTLSVDMTSGKTTVAADEPSPVTVGLTVRIKLPGSKESDGNLAREAIDLATHGSSYTGPSSPWWYSPGEFHRLLQHVSPVGTTVGAFCADLGLELADDRAARDLSAADAKKLLRRLRDKHKPVEPSELGMLGRDAFDAATGYKIWREAYKVDELDIPVVIEVFASCSHSIKGVGQASFSLLLNRTPSMASLSGISDRDGITLFGCGIGHVFKGPPVGLYTIVISVICPKIDLTTDGKEPSLLPFLPPIGLAIRKACKAAHRAMAKPPGRMSLKEAAHEVMAEAYDKVSDEGRLPANARQLMYAARPTILLLTGQAELSDKYFTQVLLPDYIAANSEETADWNVVYDARGGLREPHTGTEIRLGTLEVRGYCARESIDEPSIDFAIDRLYPTSGPEHRYSTVLFVEKEGFDSLLLESEIEKRYDLAVMSTKGTSTTAARELVDDISRRGVERVLVLHDFDRKGFGIFGTLGTDSRRFTFSNEVNIIDIGLRLADIEAMGLASEPVDDKGDWDRHAATLRRHGATWEEIEFLREGRRVELNAMTSKQFIELIEAKMDAHGVEKVVPDDEILERHAHYVVGQSLVQKTVRATMTSVRAQAAAAVLPANLRQRIEALLQNEPTLSWDIAVAQIVLAETG